MIDDVGSGALAEGVTALRRRAAGAPLGRRRARRSSASRGDKLLGGPQAGLLVGRADAVAAARAHPLARALRIDKLSLAALEATLRLYRDPARARREIPVLAMLEAAEASSPRGPSAARGDGRRRRRGRGRARAARKVGGGALPLLELEGPVVAVEPGAHGADGLGRPRCVRASRRSSRASTTAACCSTRAR